MRTKWYQKHGARKTTPPFTYNSAKCFNRNMKFKTKLIVN